MREFIGIERRSCGSGWHRGPRPSSGNRRRSSNQPAQKVRTLLPRGRATFAAPDGTKLACLPKPRAALFDFGEERLETLASGVFIFGQPGLEQTQKTKSVVHTQRRVTPRALVRLMRVAGSKSVKPPSIIGEGKSQERRVITYLACSELAASAPQRWRSSSSMSAGFSTVWATSSRNNQR